MKVSVVEAGPALLGPFDSALQEYAHGLFQKRDIDVRLGTAVVGVEEFEHEGYHFTSKKAMLSDGSSIEFGTMVWSAGLAPRSFTDSLEDMLALHPGNRRILVDDCFRVKGHEGSIWAAGDAAATESNILPQLAQVARQQGIYLAKIFNGQQKEDEAPCRFFSLGSSKSVGVLMFLRQLDGTNPDCSCCVLV